MSETQHNIYDDHTEKDWTDSMATYDAGSDDYRRRALWDSVLIIGFAIRILDRRIHGRHSPIQSQIYADHDRLRHLLCKHHHPRYHVEIPLGLHHVGDRDIDLTNHSERIETNRPLDYAWGGFLYPVFLDSLLIFTIKSFFEHRAHSFAGIDDLFRADDVSWVIFRWPIE